MAKSYQRQNYDRFRRRSRHLLLWGSRVEPYPRLGGKWNWWQAHRTDKRGAIRRDAQVPHERADTCHDEIKSWPWYGREQNEADHLLSFNHKDSCELDSVSQLWNSIHTNLYRQVLHSRQEQEVKEQEAVAIKPAVQNRNYRAEHQGELQPEKERVPRSFQWQQLLRSSL